jgi:hypothetical protein
LLAGSRGSPLRLGEPASQLVDRPPLRVEFTLEGAEPPAEPDLPQKGDNREHGNAQADQREKEGNQVHRTRL